MAALSAPDPPICQKCGYSLAGLPAIHVCPECGLEYDPHSVVIPLYGRSHAGTNAFWGFLIAAAIAYTTLEAGQPLYDVVPCALPLFIFAALSARRWLRGVETGRFLFASHRGIRLTHPDFSAKTIEWSAFGSAHVRWLTGRFRIRGRNGKTLLRCHYGQLGSFGQAREIAAKLNQLAQVYAEPPASPNPPPASGSKAIAHSP